MPPLSSYTVATYTPDPNLMRTRSLVLANAGFTVHAACHLSDFAQLVETKSVDLFLLCHTFTNEVCADAVRAAERGSPHSRILILRAGGHWGETWLSHPVVNSLDGPPALLAAIHRTLDIPQEIFIAPDNPLEKR